MTLPIVSLLACVLAAQTTVSARGTDDEARTSLPESAALADPSSGLAALPGVTLLHDGAPLAPTRVTVRGASGARMSATYAGLALTDPLDGLLDVEALPWAAVQLAAVDAGARELRLEPDARTSVLRARVLAGALSTLRVGALAATPTAHGHMLVAAEAGTTRGDFLFAVPSPVSGEPPTLLVRENDDHRRASATAVLHESFGDASVEAAALAAHHAGGVPGFATHPTEALRREDLTGMARLRVSRANASVAPFVDATVRGSERVTFHDGALARERVTARAARAAAGVTLETGDVRALVDAHAERAQAQVLHGGTPERRIVGGHVDGNLALGSGFMVHASTDADLVTDAGPLFSGRLRVSGGDTVRGALAISRATRPPTLDELYAPRGFVLGNPQLKPERLTDLEGTLSARLGAILLVRAALWAGRIDETILYLNRNAFEVAPENTGGAWRAGADGALRVSPGRALALDTTISLLASRLDATGAPLPLTPGFAALTALRMGPRDGGHVVARATSRGASSATLFGTLAVPGYTLVDLIGIYPIAPSLALGVSVRNAFDVLDARDQNGLPLPGRLLFVSLEVTG